jgi:hypothetical protein
MSAGHRPLLCRWPGSVSILHNIRYAALKETDEGRGLIAIVAVGSRTAAFAKGQNGILQYPHAREPQCRGSGIEPVIPPDERRDTLALTVRLPGRSSKSWCRLDEDAERNGLDANRDSGGYDVRRRVDHRHVVGE